jgi:hypothetical protein
MRKQFGALLLAASVLTSLGSAGPAHAIGEVVFTESFESCVKPGSSPSFANLNTAINSGNIIYVNLWSLNTLNCPSWTPSGQAWLAEYSSGESFPDGTQAVWLNEGSPTAGSVTHTISGFSAGNDYKITLGAWTDDQDAPTALFVTVTNGANVINDTVSMSAGQGVQDLEYIFSALGDSVTLTFMGSSSTQASPIIDNIVITNNGVTPDPEDPVDPEDPESGGGNESTNNLAATGFDTIAAGVTAFSLLVSGAAVLAARRRASRR